jgi:hypothetical protein
MNETEQNTDKPVVTMHRRILEGVPVYEGIFESLKHELKYRIVVIPPATIQEKIYKAVVTMSYIILESNGNKSYCRGPEETYWGYRMDTVTTWIETLTDAELMMHTGEGYSK